ncbi:hypothetical protein SLE2022_179230 [Rubroshorea leprosula]
MSVKLLPMLLKVFSNKNHVADVFVGVALVSNTLATSFMLLIHDTLFSNIPLVVESGVSPKWLMLLKKSPKLVIGILHPFQQHTPC